MANSYTRESIDKILLYWIDQFGHEYVTKRGNTQLGVPVDSEPRIDMYYKLVYHLVKKEKLTEDDLRGPLITGMVVNISAPLNYDKTKLAEWQKIARNDWFRAINIEFPTDMEDVAMPERKERPRTSAKKKGPKGWHKPVTEDVSERSVLEGDRLFTAGIKPASVIEEDVDIFADESEGSND